MDNLPTQTLVPDGAGYETGAAILARGGLVAFPTETVYGLGADARNDRAVAGIFAAKDRPRFNPLIVHVADINTAQTYVEWSDLAQRLADAFWPGPLTMVLPRKPDTGLSALVTADLPTLAIRIPADPVAQALLHAFGGPVAAPSANPSGRISPTTAAHVINGLAGRIDAVIDAGPCAVGVESTILGVSPDVQLLRVGGIATEDIEAVVGHALALPETTDTTDTHAAPLTSPGQMASHYAPNAKIRLNATDLRDGELLLGFGDVDCALNLSPTRDLTEAAARLFDYLHRLDAREITVIAVSPIPETGLGRAINDRLRRAAAPRPKATA